MANSLDPLSRELETIRVEFERYFMGLEKRPPYARRDQLFRKIRRFEPGTNAVERFRHKNLIYRLTTLEQYWSRIQRAMEMGTHSKNVALADFRQSRKTPRETAKKKERPAEAVGVKGERAAQKEVTAVAHAASDFLKTLNEQESPGAPKARMRGKAKERGEF